MLITMADHSEHAPGEGIAPLPRKAAKRRRIQLLEGSSSILQPYPCTEGEFCGFQPLLICLSSCLHKRRRMHLLEGNSSILQPHPLL